ncbi:hypothetical protein [Paraflavitalea sp. CAU 1676]|uniref:hypothetical protein n=1 Tax=Paraflavitalea sp. CAU 1676 TaxID=3032598 RepID=UPI0023DC9A77|nr:hypothetical protein [Paraflavitalea sp. CAU 1676]MDF2188219.1 hypothetical protein [Paraflavitalea sp. CAU 1676]
MPTLKSLKNALSVLIAVLLTNNFCVAQSKDTTDKVSVTVEVISKGSSDYYKEKAEGYFIRASVSNTQDTAISFVVMTCSWPSDNWATNNLAILMSGRGCDSNSPERITLEPQQSISFNGFIMDTHQKLAGKKFRFAFLYYDNFDDLLVFYKERKPKKEIPAFWSNEVRLEDNIFSYKVDTVTISANPKLAKK